jgi:predicted nucleotidyltransferase
MKNLTREQKIEALRIVKEVSVSKGILLVGVFGSFARAEEDVFSDVDIAYSIDREVFSRAYPDGFGKILALDEMKKILEEALHSRVDLVSLQSKNTHFLKSIQKEMVYV